MNYLKSLAFGQYESEVKQCECDGSSSGGGPLVVKITNTSNGDIMDKTWQEIYDAKSHVFYKDNEEDGSREYFILIGLGPEFGQNPYYVSLGQKKEERIDLIIFTADSADEYPRYIDNAE